MSSEVNKQSHIVNGLILYKLAFFSLIFLGCTCKFVSYIYCCFIYFFLWEEKGGLQYMLALIA